MKNFFGEMINTYFETAKTGKLTATYGSGQVRTDNMTVPPGLYVLTSTIQGDTSAGKSLATGIFHTRIHSTTEELASGSHNGNGGYGMTYNITRIVKFDEDTTIYALGQTSSSENVGGGMKVILRAAKIS